MKSPEGSPATVQKTLIGFTELLISWLLRIGVATSLAIIVAGLVLTFIHHPSYMTTVSELERLTDPGAAFPHTLSDIADGVIIWRGQAVISLGLIVLIGTPIARVAVSVVAFAFQRDWVFVLITSLVLAILLGSFLLGHEGRLI